MSSSNVNGSAQRKSLAGQLDRLDGILDGLADGLNAAVASAVKEAVTRAVEAALKEVLSNAELHKHINRRAQNRTSTVKKLWSWLRVAVAGVCGWLANVTRRGRQKVAEG
jgi:hypothetical protein